MLNFGPQTLYGNDIVIDEAPGQPALTRLREAKWQPLDDKAEDYVAHFRGDAESLTRILDAMEEQKKISGYAATHYPGEDPSQAAVSVVLQAADLQQMKTQAYTDRESARRAISNAAPPTNSGQKGFSK